VTVTVLLGLASAVCWGAPDLWLAQAARKLGAFPVVFGATVIGLLAVAPIAAFVDPPDEWPLDGVLLGLALGPVTVVGYIVGFTAFRGGAVSVVAPIIACEGGIAALFAIAGGERVGGLVAAFLPVAVAGVILAAMGQGGGRAAVVPAAIAAVIWGGVLALSAPVADDLGAYWAFMLIRSSALVVMIPFALRTGAVRAWLDDRRRVVVWGLGDAAGYLLFAYAADRGPVSVASVLVAQFATVAVIVGMVFGGERLLPRQLVGIGLVIAAVTGMAAGGA
jgi:drug/metabolite transporter (DMT)-like permease